MLVAISRPDLVKRIVSVSGVFNADYWVGGRERFEAIKP